eukprot:TRINITY_DN31874_c0_g1_i1.p1 TRINITY_DN31874_c0_g1~~TRINITY_DN31874_c0_g1_i1.p1  ORF type:complete len:294 (-),score=44.70 TRINITY_DN31874_c0_g1_i1:124-1005(-)
MMIPQDFSNNSSSSEPSSAMTLSQQFSHWLQLSNAMVALVDSSTSSSIYYAMPAATVNYLSTFAQLLPSWLSAKAGVLGSSARPLGSSSPTDADNNNNHHRVVRRTTVKTRQFPKFSDTFSQKSSSSSHHHHKSPSGQSSLPSLSFLSIIAFSEEPLAVVVSLLDEDTTTNNNPTPPSSSSLRAGKRTMSLSSRSHQRPPMRRGSSSFPSVDRPRISPTTTSIFSQNSGGGLHASDSDANKKSTAIARKSLWSSIIVVPSFTYSLRLTDMLPGLRYLMPVSYTHLTLPTKRIV